MSKRDDQTLSLTMSLDEARIIAPAIQKLARQVCERPFKASGDPFGAMHDAARTYAALMVMFKKVSAHCGRHNVELLDWNGRTWGC